jgi:hypothetical protein
MEDGDGSKDERPTSNFQLPFKIGCWTFDVRCSMFLAFLAFLALSLSSNISKNDGSSLGSGIIPRVFDTMNL